MNRMTNARAIDAWPVPRMIVPTALAWSGIAAAALHAGPGSRYSSRGEP
jgi:hypothetical protein